MKSIVILAGVAIMLAGTAQAASVTNRDTSNHRIVITPSGGEGAAEEIVVAAEGSLDEICMEGCMMGVDGGEAMEVEANDQLVIEDGELSFE